MRLLLILIAAGLAGCGEPQTGQSKAPQKEMETAADEAQESIGTALDKAQGVENVLQDAANTRDAAIEESSDND